MDKFLEKARAFFGTTAGRVVAALLVAAAILAYTHHRGAVSATAKLEPQIEQLKQQLAEAKTKPAAPDIPYWQCNGPKETRHPQCRDEEAEAQLAERVARTEQGNEKLAKKVADYEKQLAKRAAKAGAFTLSPADARSLSNIK
ncbi:hypothetical protein NK6_8853 [Bradyrhizobium diazoefficiens]|uniref:Uncharacterized protein n=1 Tax=Bradyrhizobium diazoefficiens TaxID=1355477 RepID=A0A0E4FXQ5_9BRAD|nr:hypothetical protein NK6_8853 [Bradyrhizobium diazoefficiens]